MGSPCQIPLEILKKSSRVPLISSEIFEVDIQLKIMFIHCLENQPEPQTNTALP